MEIVEFGELDQYLAPKGTSVAVLLCSEKFFAKVEIVGIGFKLLVGFRFKVPVGFGFKVPIGFDSNSLLDLNSNSLFVRFVFKVLVGFEFKFSVYIYSSYGCVFCVVKNIV